MITLKGMTWDHSRGYDPMISTSKVFAKKHNNKIAIEWDKKNNCNDNVYKIELIE